MRRVLHVTPFMAERAGGPPVVVRRIAEHSQKFGWGSAVLTTELMATDGELQSAAMSQFAGVEILKARRRIAEFWPTEFERARVASAVKSADLVHIHGIWHPLLTGVASQCRRTGVPYVVMPHGMLDPYSLQVKALSKRLYLELVEKRTIAGAAGIVFTTAREREEAASAISFLPRSFVVPLAGDAIGAAGTEDLAWIRGRIGGGRAILFLGRVHPKKGLEHAISALRSIKAVHPNAVLVVAGEGDEAYKARLNRLARELSVDGSIIWLGHITGGLKAAALAASELFILPSLQENFGIAVVEAMASRLPVVISRAVNLAQEVEAVGAGIVVGSEDVQTDLEQAITAVLSDPTKARQMGEQGYLLSVTSFSWERSTEQMCLAYSAAMEAAHQDRRSC